MLQKALLNLLRFWKACGLPRGGAVAKLFFLFASRYGLVAPHWRYVNGCCYWTDLGDYDCRTIALSKGNYCREVLGAILSHLPESGTFVDVGANIGYVTLQVSKHVGPNGRVVAIEPDPQTALVLRKNVANNSAANVTVIEVACSSHKVSAKFFPAPRSHSGKSSLSERNAGSDRAVQLNCEPLDSITETAHLERVDVVKIDVEGAEMQVLRGMERLLSQFHPIVIVEIDASLLAAFGTTPADIETRFFVSGVIRSSGWILATRFFDIIPTPLLSPSSVLCLVGQTVFKHDRPLSILDQLINATVSRCT